MRYETLRNRAWSHRGVVAMAAIVVIAATAIAATPPKNEDLYSLRFTIERREKVLFDVGVIDNATKDLVKGARVMAEHGQWATWTGDHNGRSIEIRMRMEQGRPAELFLTVTGAGEVIQRNLYTWQPNVSEFTGQPIDLHLKNADIRDVMNTFGEITGLEIQVAPDIEAKVSIDVDNMPWDQALMEVAKLTGTKVVMEGGIVRVTK